MNMHLTMTIERGVLLSIVRLNWASFSLKVKLKSLSHIQLFATLWTVAHQAPPPVVFSRQEYWSGLPFTSPGGLPNPGVEPMSLASPASTSRLFTTVPPGGLEVLPYLQTHRFHGCWQKAWEAWITDKWQLTNHSNSSNQSINFCLVPQALLPTGQSEEDQGMPACAMGWVAREGTHI